VITRLDETCREVRDAARVIGDADLFKKMEESQIKIKRDSAWHHFRNCYDAQIPCSGCSCFRCKSVFLSNSLCIASNLHYSNMWRPIIGPKRDGDAYIPKVVVKFNFLPLPSFLRRLALHRRTFCACEHGGTFYNKRCLFRI
jgi:hypothetical protein